MFQEVQPKTHLLCFIQSQIWSYFGYFARRDGDSLEKVITQGRVDGSRKPRRPRTRWIDQVKSLAGSNSLREIFILLQRIMRDGMPFLMSKLSVMAGLNKPTNQPTMQTYFPDMLTKYAALSYCSEETTLQHW